MDWSKEIFFIGWRRLRETSQAQVEGKASFTSHLRAFLLDGTSRMRVETSPRT